MGASVIRHDVRQHHPSDRLGVSLIICCHNSAKLLPTALANIRNQRVSGDLEWEVLVVDNASTDDTAQVAYSCWSGDVPASLRVIQEPNLGLCHARERGFTEAKFEAVSFIDDDNLICPDWVAVVSEAMAMNPAVGAIGSVNRAISDVPLPQWFRRYCEFYACWASSELSAVPTMLNGAGMTIRKSVWEELRNNGFESRLTDRVGTRLSSCGDLELGLAIKLAGWKILIEPRLQLDHYLSAERLRWNYLRRLMRGIGESNVLLDFYFNASQEGHTHPPVALAVEVGFHHAGLIDRIRKRYWWWKFVSEARRLLRRYSVRTLIKCCFAEMYDDDDAPDIEWRVGRLVGLIRMRSRYISLQHDIGNAPWRKRETPFWDLPGSSAS